MEASDFSRDRNFLRAHRLLLRAGLSLVAAFAWVFVFEYAFAFSGSIPNAFICALLVYALSQATTALLTPISAAHLRSGVKRAMVAGALLAALSFAILGGTLAGYFSAPASGGIVLFGIFFGGYRALYWIPYRLQSAPLAKGPNAFFELLVALMPAFAGLALVSVELAPLRLLFGAAALAAISILPVLPIRDIGEHFKWDYGETFQKLFDRRNRALATRAALSGIEGTALFLVWPLAIFLILRSYLLLGLVMSASLLVLLVAREAYRALVRDILARDSVVLDVAFAVSGWILRLAAGSPIAFVFADSYSYVSAPKGAPGFFSREHGFDGESYLDEYTALQEIAQCFGRILMCVFVGILIFAAPLPAALTIALLAAACAAGAAAALSHRMRRRAY